MTICGQISEKYPVRDRDDIGDMRIHDKKWKSNIYNNFKWLAAIESFLANWKYQQEIAEKDEIGRFQSTKVANHMAKKQNWKDPC